MKHKLITVLLFVIMTGLLSAEVFRIGGIGAMELMNNPALGKGTTWVTPKSIHDPEVRVQPIGQIYNTITNGVRTMSAYGPQIPTEDRWAIAAWVRVLQRSQFAKPDDVPAAQRENLPVVDLTSEAGQ